MLLDKPVACRAAGGAGASALFVARPSVPGVDDAPKTAANAVVLAAAETGRRIRKLAVVMEVADHIAELGPPLLGAGDLQEVAQVAAQVHPDGALAGGIGTGLCQPC